MKRLSLKKMLLLFMAVSTLLVVGVDLYAGMIYCRDLRSQEIVHTNELLDEMAQQIDLRINVIQRNLKQLSEKNSILNFISMDRVSKMETAEYIQSLLDSYTETEPSMMSLCLHTTEGTFLRGNSNTTDASNYQLLRAYFKSVHKFDLNNSFRSPKYGRVYDVGEADYGSDAYLIAIMTPVFEMNYSGALTALVDISKLTENVIRSSSPMILLCEDQPLWSSSADLYDIAAQTALGDSIDINSSTMDVYRKDMESVSWTLCLLSERKGLYDDLPRYLKDNMLLIVCVLLIQGTLLFVIYYWIIRQIENISFQMEGIGVEGDANTNKIYIPYRSSNEIVVLARGINGMLQRVEALNQQVNHAQIAYLDQHIMFLQSQINPHFLFNCLSSIRGMASRQCWENVRTMTENMAKIYRYCMDENTTSIVSREIESIHWYAMTFETRYGNTAEIRCEADPASEDCVVPRMILQPLVENAFLHSFARNRFNGGLIQVTSRIENGMLVIRLENDGAAVDDTVLNQMNGITALQQQSRGIGIVNVRKRIELLGGKQASLTYEHRKGGGVIAIIRFPIQYAL